MVEVPEAEQVVATREREHEHDHPPHDLSLTPLGPRACTTIPVMPIVVIVGPTGAGKTRLSLALAAHIGGEVVSCDSQQVYIGMDIGTGKATAEERARVPHHLLDIARPDEEMTAARFVELADRAIADLAARGKTAIVCGGTGLYVRALLLGLFDGPPASPAVRAELAQLGLAGLAAELARVDPAAATRIDPHDEKRMIRALEVFRLTGETMSAHRRGTITARCRAVTPRSWSGWRRRARSCTARSTRAWTRCSPRGWPPRWPSSGPPATCHRCGRSRRSATPSSTTPRPGRSPTSARWS
jgi:hypothetical protein